MNNEESIKRLNNNINELKEENLKLRTIIGEMQNEKALEIC